jgi:hypothetical protein
MPCRFDIFISRLEMSRPAAKSEPSAASDQSRTRRDQRDAQPAGPARPFAKKDSTKRRDKNDA